MAQQTENPLHLWRLAYALLFCETHLAFFNKTFLAHLNSYGTNNSPWLGPDPLSYSFSLHTSPVSVEGL